MKDKSYKSIFFLFCKERNLISKVLQLVEKPNSYYNYFDKTLTWDGTSEGYGYWYHLQLDLVFFCLEMKNRICNHYDNEVLNYYRKLLVEYRVDEYSKQSFFINHMNNLKKIENGKV